MIVRSAQDEVEHFINRAHEVRMVIQALLNNRPKKATGIYFNKACPSIIWGYRTNPRKFPDNWLPLENLEEMV